MKARELLELTEAELFSKETELKDKLYIRDTWGAEIIEELRPRPADIIVKKQKHDGFIGTEYH